MEQKEKISMPMQVSVSNQTHLQLRCLPHATGISPNSYITIAIRSLHTSPLHETPTLLPYVNENHNDPETLGIIYHGTQFRIEATVTGIGGALHSTPVGTVASSVLMKNGNVNGDGNGNSTSGTNIQGDGNSYSNNSAQGADNEKNHQPSTSFAFQNHNHQQHYPRQHVQPQVTSTHSCSWDKGNTLILPVRYKDVQRESCIRLKLITTRSRIVGEALFPLWDALGVLKTGLHRVKVDMSSGKGGIQNQNQNEDETESKNDNEWKGYGHDDRNDYDEKWEASLILDQLHCLKQAEQQSAPKSVVATTNSGTGTQVSEPSTIQKYSRRGADRNPNSNTGTNNGTSGNSDVSPKNERSYGAIESVPWLDAITEDRCLDILQEHIFSDSENSGDKNNSVDILGDDRYATLIVELPDCTGNIPIVHQEVLYTMGHQGASGSVTALDLSLYHHEQKQYHQQKQDTSSGKILMPDPVRYSTNDPNGMNLKLVQMLDPESPDSNPVEDKYRTLQHELIRGLVDPALKPDASERSRLNTIISGTSQHLTREEKDLLWRFRFSLVDNRRALTKFLLAVEWGVESEVVQAAELLEQWRKRSPIEVSDALKLLGKNVAFQTGLVRAYAIDTLAAAPDAELVLYLLQLVQALKYENDSGEIGPGISSRHGALKTKKRTEGTSSLCAFLIDRASKNLEFANYLYWYLKVELGDSSSSSTQRYHDAFNAMEAKLTSVQVGKRTMWDILSTQDEFISNVMDCQRKSRDSKGKKDAKEQHLKDSLKVPQLQNINNNQSVPLPSNPVIWVKGVKAESAKMFKSAMYPALLDFHVDNKSNSTGEARAKKPGPTYKVIVKTGDDLRQDQLVIMLIKLFDRILKRGALDLCLKPYPIMAMSQDTGLVEFVDCSLPVSQILANYNNSILSFFKSVAPSPGAKYDVEPKVMQTYIRSCAGYCVITYLIGVGDRHLDNLLITKRGHFFHIDFGFIFGRDPKPLPPLFRLTREMVDGMGGIESNEYRQFCSLACQTFNLLRKRAGLVLNLLHLMSDAGIEDLSHNPNTDAEGVIAKVEERFRLELNDEQAETYFLGLINDTLAAFAPRVMDVFHQIAVARR